VGTTKLTRKEILAEDPVHGSMIMLVDYFSKNKKIIAIITAAAVFLALGVYGGFIFLEKKDMEGQEILGRGIDCYHAEIDPEAPENPFENGPAPVFKTDSLKYQYAAKEFESIVSGFGYSRVSPIARYYLGLTQLKLGEKEEGVKNLEVVAADSKGKTIGYLAQQVLARLYMESGNYEEARKILETLMADDKYELPREELMIQLSRALTATGNRQEAVKILQEGVSQSSSLSPMRQKLMAELEKVQEVQPELQP